MARQKKQVSNIFSIMIELLEDSHYHGTVDYDYHCYKKCENGSDCCENDYCRCGTITNAKVTSVNILAIIKKAIGTHSDIDLYCIDRVLRATKIYESSNWKVNISGGYYGEEVHGAEVTQEYKEKITVILQELAGLTSDLEKVRKVLDLEYGWLTKRVTEATQVQVQEMLLSQVSPANENHMVKIDSEAMEFYNGHELPLGIVFDVRSSSGYGMIDGHHRFLAAKRNQVKKAKFLVLA